MTTERIKQIQSKTAHPDSASVQQALIQVWNEVYQECKGIEKQNRTLIIKNTVLNPNGSIDVFFADDDIMPINVII